MRKLKFLVMLLIIATTLMSCGGGKSNVHKEASLKAWKIFEKFNPEKQEVLAKGLITQEEYILVLKESDLDSAYIKRKIEDLIEEKLVQKNVESSQHELSNFFSEYLVDADCFAFYNYDFKSSNKKMNRFDGLVKFKLDDKIFGVGYRYFVHDGEPKIIEFNEYGVFNE